MLECLSYVSSGDVEGVERCLRQLSSLLVTMTHSLSKTFTLVHPHAFYHRVRPYVAGWKGNPVLDGLIYEGVEGEGHKGWWHGGSAAQSSLIATFDVFLGVKHESQHTAEYLQSMRQYMPRKHRQ